MLVKDNNIQHFVPESIKSLFKVVYSEEHREEEQLSYIYFMDFLDECQSK